MAQQLEYCHKRKNFRSAACRENDIEQTLTMYIHDITQYGSTVYIGMALVWPAL